MCRVNDGHLEALRTLNYLDQKFNLIRTRGKINQETDDWELPDHGIQWSAKCKAPADAKRYLHSSLIMAKFEDLYKRKPLFF